MHKENSYSHIITFFLFLFATLIAFIGISPFTIYFITDTMLMAYISLYLYTITLLFSFLYKFTTPFKKVNILLLSVLIVLNIAVILSRSFVVSMVLAYTSCIEGFLLFFVGRYYVKSYKGKEKKVLFGFTVIVAFLVFLSIPAAVTANVLVSNANYDSSFSVFDGKEYKNIVYGEDPARNNMSIYVPRKTKPQADDNAAIIFLHPGGWNAGFKELCSSDAKRFAKKGYITATVNYSFINEGNDFLMEDLIDDITLALKELKSQSDKRGWNIKKIALCGYSAGAHLSMLYAYNPDYNKQSPFEISFISSKAGPFAFEKIDYFPPDIIYTAAVLGGRLNTKEFLYDKKGQKLPLEELIYKDEVLDVLKRISPSTYVTDESAPTLFCQGGKDDLISLEQVEDIKAKFSLAEFKSEIIICENSTHLFFEKRSDLKEFYNRLEEWAEHFFCNDA